MSNSFGTNPLASNPLGGQSRLTRSYSSGHLFVLGAIDVSPIATYVLGGIAVLAGLICIFQPGAGVWAIVLGCAIWFLMTGIGDLFVAAAVPANRLWFGLLGVLSIVAALSLLVNPGVAIVTVALVAGISFLVRGAGKLGLGWRMRRSVR